MKIQEIKTQFKEFLKNYLGALTTQGLNFKMLPTLASEDAGKSSRRWAQSGHVDCWCSYVPLLHEMKKKKEQMVAS